MLKARAIQYNLDFKRPSGTSRGVLTQKETWFIQIWDENNPQCIGTGECGLLRGLSCDDSPHYHIKIKDVCERINEYQEILSNELKDWPSIVFGIETALLDLKAQGSKRLFNSPFINGDSSIPINGLIWMGEKEFMFQQIKEKLEQGFDCIKLKIGAINFDEELSLLNYIRSQFDAQTITIRVDANGAFSPETALEKLNRLSEYEIHSIEQPIKAGLWDKMAQLCLDTPLDIALDEELIGINDFSKKKKLIETILPQYIILKPSLHGGLSGSMEWINLAKQSNANWWITSALESNVGLNAIAQWTATLNNPLPQGLGTGQLYTNNIPSPLKISKGHLFYTLDGNWDLKAIQR